MVSASLTNFPLDTISNLDVIYEAWIFFEIINIVSQKYGQIYLQMKNKPYYFEFKYKDNLIKFFYEKNFEKDGQYAWAVTSTPDFSVMTDDRIIAIFDAKNYAKDSKQKNEATNKMLAYITNLDTNFGALFFPDFKQNKWVYPREDDNPRYHFNLKIAHYRIQPKDSEQAITTTKSMILDLLDEIINRI